MRTLSTRRTVFAVLTAAGIAAGAVTATAVSEDSRAIAPQRITASGVGDVTLGKTFRELRRAGLVGRLRSGCEFGGPQARSAALRAPLRGSVDLTRTSPRKVEIIAVRGGATARGVGVGDRARRVRRAYPKVRFDHSTDDVFGITIARVPRNGGGRIEFAINTETNRVQLIAVPFIAFCD